MMGKSILIISERGITASNLLFKLAEEIHAQKLDLDIDHVAFSALGDKISKKTYDLLLVTPQVRRYEEETRAALAKFACGARVLAISEDDFNFMNIPHILTQITKEL